MHYNNLRQFNNLLKFPFRSIWKSLDSLLWQYIMPKRYGWVTTATPNTPLPSGVHTTWPGVSLSGSSWQTSSLVITLRRHTTAWKMYHDLKITDDMSKQSDISRKQSLRNKFILEYMHINIYVILPLGRSKGASQFKYERFLILNLLSTCCPDEQLLIWTLAKPSQSIKWSFQRQNELCKNYATIKYLHALLMNWT